MGARKGPSVCMKPINNSVTRALVTGKWTTQQFNRGATRGTSQVAMVPGRNSSLRREAGGPGEEEAGKAGLRMLTGTGEACCVVILRRERQHWMLGWWAHVL